MLKSDNNSCVHPKILKAIIKSNIGDENPYGDDKYTEKAIKLLKKEFGENIDVYFTTTGTAANVIGLSSVLNGIYAVISADTAHINTEEGGAFEKITGSKIITVPNYNGKIKVSDLEHVYNMYKNDIHLVEPKVVSITQTTERGTIYSLEEMIEISNFCKKNNLLFHVDGARLANASVALNSTLKELTNDVGVDILSFGGAKNGMMMGEAIIFFNKDLSRNTYLYMKQSMQLISKMRYISAQFIEYMKDDLWYENAKKANEMGQYLRKELLEIEHIKVNKSLYTNIIFARADNKIINSLQDKYGFYVIDPKKNLIRLITSFNTTKEEIDEFIYDVNSLY